MAAIVRQYMHDIGFKIFKPPIEKSLEDAATLWFWYCETEALEMMIDIAKIVIPNISEEERYPHGPTKEPEYQKSPQWTEEHRKLYAHDEQTTMLHSVYGWF